MDPIVKKPSSQEVLANQCQKFNNGVEVGSGAHPKRDLCQRHAFASETDRSITHTFSGEQNQQGIVTTSRNPDFGEQYTDDSLRTSQVHQELDKGSTGSFSNECGHGSFCCNFPRDRCFHGTNCSHFKSEYASFVMPEYDWCVKFHLEIQAASENLGGRASSFDMSVLSKKSSPKMNSSVNHEGSEKIGEVKQLLETSKIEKRKRSSKCNERQLDMHSSGNVDSTTPVHAKSIDEIKQALKTSGSLDSTIPVHAKSIDEIKQALKNSYKKRKEGHSISLEQPMKTLIESSYKKRKEGHSISLERPMKTLIDPSIRVLQSGSHQVLIVNNAITTNHHLQASNLSCSKGKLLILDLNGLLADLVPSNKSTRGLPVLSGKAVYRRPFYEDFINFCFENFDVGVWSSRKRHNVDQLLEYLMGEKAERLLFCWDQSYCTVTGFKTLANKEKPLVLKELKKLWEKHRPEAPWDKGYYNETNTVLVDDSPYKALRNPPNTAIFPYPYTFGNKSDDSLGPKGDLRLYLARLAEADNTQEFIRANPFGQNPLTKSEDHWDFYSQIVTPQPENWKNKNNGWYSTTKPWQRKN